MVVGSESLASVLVDLISYFFMVVGSESLASVLVDRIRYFICRAFAFLHELIPHLDWLVDNPLSSIMYNGQVRLYLVATVWT